jgi:hypothetical protein
MIPKTRNQIAKSKEDALAAFISANMPSANPLSGCRSGR